MTVFVGKIFIAAWKMQRLVNSILMVYQILQICNR
jgi:hypothetical protein